MACVLTAAVNLAAAAMLSPRAGAPVSATAQSDPAASVSSPPAASPPVPLPEPAPRVSSASTPEPAPRVPAASRPTQLPPRDAVATVPRESLDLPPRAASRSDADRAALRAALDEWIAATNRRDLARQMTFYPPTLSAFYRERNVARSAVLAEKRRLFARAEVIDVQASTPEITLDGVDTATMRFRKTYDIRGPQASRRGEVVQELRWTKTPEGWKITSERDVQVIR